MFSIFRAPNVPVPTQIPVEGGTKDILVESPLVVSIKSVVDDEKNDTIPLQNEPVSANDDDALRQHELPSEATQANLNKTDGGDEIAPDSTVEENQIPVFSEWAQKRLEEVEKEVEQEAVNTSTMKKNASTASKQPVLKLKNSKNYASPDCGAKIIAANSESSGTGYVLTSTRDEYLLSPCKSRIWFVVELCEAIQAERIDLANFELFSSSPKNFTIGVSSRFPTREWTNVGKFIAKDERYIQSFDLYPHLFGKYVRVDIHSHYNSEHFCPISLFRVYGTSEFEAFETENRQHPIDDDDDDDVDDQEADTNKSKSNIFKSASDAVMSIVDTVKKAASFVKHNENKTADIDLQSASNLHPSNGNCISPNHAISCEKCTNHVAREVTALIECKQQLLHRLLSISVIRNSLYKSQICNTLIGFDLNINCSEPTDINGTASKQLTDLQMDYITHLFSLKYITAMCNLLAASDRKTSWNSTIPVSAEPPINVTIDQKGGDQLLSTDELKQKPTMEPVQIDPPDKSTSEEDSAENKVQTEQQQQQQQQNVPTDSTETSQESEVNDKYAGNVEKDSTESTTVTPAVDSNEIIPDKDGQNIFNIVDAVETNTEKVIAVEAPSTESIVTNTVKEEPETAPAVIILPDTSTSSSSTPPTPPAPPSNDLNDAGSEEQGTNGWTNTPHLGQKLHSESVFLRLSNRVKVI